LTLYIREGRSHRATGVCLGFHGFSLRQLPKKTCRNPATPQPHKQPSSNRLYQHNFCQTIVETIYKGGIEKKRNKTLKHASKQRKTRQIKTLNDFLRLLSTQPATQTNPKTKKQTKTQPVKPKETHRTALNKRQSKPKKTQPENKSQKE